MTILNKIRYIIFKSGGKLSPYLICGMIFGIILESISIGLIMPLIVMLSKGSTIYTKGLILKYRELTGIHSYWLFILSMLALVLLVYLIKTVFLTTLTKKQNKFIYNLEANISEKLLAAYLNQPYIFHIEHNSSAMIKNIYQEVKQFSNTISQMLTFFSEVMVLFLLTLVLFYFQPLATVSAIVFLGIIFVVFLRALREKIKAWGSERKNFDAKRIKTLSNIFSNIKETKLYGNYYKARKEFELVNRPAVKASMNHATFLKLPTIWLEFIAILGLTLLIGAMIVHGNTLLSIVPLLSLFAASLFRILPSFNRISAAYQTIKFNIPVIASLYKEFRAADQHIEQARTAPVSFLSEIELQDISFSYPGNSRLAIKNVSLKIKKGEFIGIKGKSGSGKSTLIDMIIGLLAPSNGFILVDGADIQSNLQDWQKQIGYVSQHINLMDDTIRRNISFAVEDNKVDDQLLDEAVDKAQLRDFIQSLTAGLDTQAGEKGVNMSGGQRQRVGIARALYHNPSVLVLDEATSSLDAGTEAEIMKTICELRDYKTIIFVTHKESLLTNCDRVFEMANGACRQR